MIYIYMWKYQKSLFCSLITPTFIGTLYKISPTMNQIWTIWIKSSQKNIHMHMYIICVMISDNMNNSLEQMFYYTWNIISSAFSVWGNFSEPMYSYVDLRNDPIRSTHRCYCIIHGHVLLNSIRVKSILFGNSYDSWLRFLGSMLPNKQWDVMFAGPHWLT